ncbi:uncharacterized protein T551_00219 [Pneumocystis jirovecii RU7]|uniref:Copper transport protein n=1 Tax=Pneumocystis jirovecii (strain RU7) TaxID=1408657 RepID=A0A0W4ZWK3_PNEJ7|nr:uncharacterized protein T551_00219 [Pneumocystis jirovecii RU7]KTW32734.1 hypothetical protein T551_00219 [Pneumocystis jirovecii RU7]
MSSQNHPTDHQNMHSTIHSNHHDHMSMNMPMTFHCFKNTTLFIKGWVPNNKLQYWLTITFIIFLGIIYRMLSTYKLYWEYKQRAIYLSQQKHSNTCTCSVSIEPTSQHSEFKFDRKLIKNILPPFKYKTSFFRGFLQLLICLFSYLLMIIVMTMNIGYFIATLIGIFIGEIILSQYNYCYVNSCDMC